MSETIAELRRLETQVAAHEQQIQEVKTMWSVVRATFIGVVLSTLWCIAVYLRAMTFHPNPLPSVIPTSALLAVLPLGIATIYCVICVIWFWSRCQSIRKPEEDLT